MEGIKKYKINRMCLTDVILVSYYYLAALHHIPVTCDVIFLKSLI